MSGYQEIFIRTITAFVLLWGFFHILGKQTLAHKSYHLFIASITMGTIAGNLAFNTRIKFQYFILSFIIMGLIIYILNLMAIKSHRLRKWITGKPVVLIEKGKILEQSMRKLGYTLEELQQALRGKDIFFIDEVELAILETNETLSVLKKTENQSITKKDLAIKADHSEQTRYPVELILDGEIQMDNLSEAYVNEQWLKSELQKRNLQVSEVSYAVVGSKGNLYIDLYQDQIKD
ncbi:DUF421 domain-containing protein [Neobacillus dielmonensis]|uniref:DUF421 domain-containing protein n=1 Tax=Neobacillus dielmonensis TaxID=1347369 RepID=UPI0005A885B5|nr:DUF421 domain-containing protein [Neobacillus dielmonensis]